MILGIVIGIVIGGFFGVSLMAILNVGKYVDINDEPEISLDQEDKFIVIEDIESNKGNIKEN